MEDHNCDSHRFSSDHSGVGRLSCDACGGDGFDDGDDGFLYCLQCGCQSQDVVLTATCAEDVGTTASGALYSLHRRRSRTTVDSPATIPPSLHDVLRGLSRSHQPLPDHTAARAKPSPAVQSSPSAPTVEGTTEPRDFGSKARLGCRDPRKVGCAIRLRYVQGLQVMLQLQCEALVERFAVSPMICGIAGTIWLRHLATSRLLDADWIRGVLTSKRAKSEEGRVLEAVKGKLRLGKLKPCGERASSIWFYWLRKAMPVYTTLAVVFLACHLAREAVLPTDIERWSLEGKLPYLAAFLDIDKYIGTAPDDCVLSTRSLFRPVQVIGAWELEATAGSIAEGVGLRLPSVNFYGIARRYLAKLGLPVHEILPYACKIYEWSMPAELWLSNNFHSLPTRVCVMAMLIVTIRILYNIQGYGAWERSLSNLSRNLFGAQSSKSDSEGLSSVTNPRRNVDDSKQDKISSCSVLRNNFVHSQCSDFRAEELLGILYAGFDKLSATPDYSKDLDSYLRYCKDVVFAGMTPSNTDQKLIDSLWDIYDNEQENDILKQGNAEVTKRPSRLPSLPLLNPKRSKIEVDGTETRNVEKQMNVNDSLDDENEERTCKHDVCNSSSHQLKGEISGPRDARKEMNNSTGLDNNRWRRIDETSFLVGDCMFLGSLIDGENIRVRQIKFDMEENYFMYLPPRVKPKSDGYIHYRRQRIDGKLIYAAHADYYILLRSCAKLAQIDIRMMHLGVLKFERGLSWIEERIIDGLRRLAKAPSEVNANNDATAC